MIHGTCYLSGLAKRYYSITKLVVMTTHSHNNERRIICPTHINAKQQRLLETAMVEAERILSLSFPFFITDPYSGKFDRLGLADVLRLTRKRILITRIDLATEQLLSTISTGQVKPSRETPLRGIQVLPAPIRTLQPWRA